MNLIFGRPKRTFMNLTTASIINSDGSMEPYIAEASTILIPSTETAFENDVDEILSDYYDYVPSGVLERLNVLILSLTEAKK